MTRRMLVSWSCSLVLLVLPGSALAQVAPADASCASGVSVADVVPADAQGTTFTGMYRGDRIAGGAGATRRLTHYWTVYRVYAGGPMPEAVAFASPACAWVALTPGVGYLFSTADIASPSVTDSLAWEVLVDDARLAPFGTYAVDDYASPELDAITTFDEALAAVAPGAGAGEAPTPADFIDEGCEAANVASLVTAERSRGTTFVGTYLADERLAAPRLRDARVLWTVERVYAGGPLPELLAMRTPACGPLTLPPGERYLFSTANVPPTVADSLAWRLLEGDRVRLAPFGDYTRDQYPDELEYRTIQDALTAVAPDAGEGQTPIRSADRLPG